MNSWKDPFGSNPLGLWLADRRDRKNRHISRIAARRGWLKPMGDRGKVLWVIAGASADSVRLAVELVRAIREKRLDIRLVLTFEQEYADMLALLDNCDKTGWGYAPCDHPRALARVMQRFEPYGVIVVGTQPRRNLSKLLDQHQRVLAINPPQPVAFHTERIYNGTSLLGTDQPTEIGDMRAILAQAQIDPNFKSLVNHGAERHLWWLHGATADSSAAIARQLFAHAADDVLFVSGERPAADCLKISSWDRTPIAGGSIVWVDDEKWLPAISAAVTATHLADIVPVTLWQAMAGGAAISCPDHALLPKPALHAAITACVNPLPVWQSWRANVIQARQQGDIARRLFWQERRLAESMSQELVQRVFEW
ncbi:MAG: glycosyltransferase N-terminal domain-containing protein [Sulfuriferula sp.]|nr:glycosyltransferase N-terminal domain-containing protein [Sulfuriferula sp.]